MRIFSLSAVLTALAAVLWVLGGGSGLAAPSGTSPPAGDFWGHWGDGKAELCGYELTFPRYGTKRPGTAVTIFVTEDFAPGAAIKHEDPSRDPGEVIPAMKLNWIQDFPTGVYDYSLMTSAFASLAPFEERPVGSPLKVSFSSQEWCGHVYSQVVFGRRRGIELTSHSYFDGEGDAERMLDHPRGGLPEDAVLLWARGFAGTRPDPGEAVEMPLLLSFERSRLLHFTVEWTAARGSRSKERRTVEVPAGSFEVETLTLAVEAVEARKTYPIGRGEIEVPATEWTIDVEAAWPHRIVRWARSDGLEARLVGSERMPYWAMNGAGYESSLERIGLAPRPPRTP